MNRLVKIELKKLFAKKMIYIFLAVVTGLMLLTTIIEKNVDKIYSAIEYNANIKLYKDSMDGYDLNDPEQVKYYVEDKNFYDTAVLAKKYKVYSPEHLYVYDTVQQDIACMNENEFITKDKEKYNECKKEYDKHLEYLNNFDWKQELLDKKKELQDEIQVLEFSINSGALTDKESEDSLKVLKLSLEVMDYRIEKGVPLDGNTYSSSLTNYINSYQQYLSEDLDKKAVTHDQKVDRNNIISEYEINKYKFENGYFKETKRGTIGGATSMSVVYTFTGSMLTVLFLVLVGGSIIAEEFNKGTIKQLLLKPYNRTKIFISKVIASVLIFTFFLCVYALITAIINGVAFGDIGSLFEPIFVYDFNQNKVLEISLIVRCLEYFLAVLPMFLILLGIAILMGVLTTNTAVSIIVPIVVYIGADIINAIANDKIMAFFPTVCWNLTEFLHGGLPSFKYSTLPISLGVDIVTIVIIYGISAFIFKRKDIKNQ